HPVTPALPIESIQPPSPLGQQLRRDKPAQTDAIAGVPGRLNVNEQPARLRANPLGRERRVVLGRLRGGELDPPLTRSHPPTPDHASGLLTPPPRQHPLEHEEHDDHDQNEQQQAPAAADRDEEKMPVTEPAAQAAPAAEPRRAAT